MFIGAGPGDPELLTVKAQNILKKCRIIIYAGSLVSPGVMALVPQRAKRYDSAYMSLEEIIDVCKEAKDKNIDVVRLHSGDPSIYGAIREQMNRLDMLEISYSVIPGVSAFQAAAAAVAAELTAPEVAQTVILTRTSGRTPLPEKQELGKLALTGATLCIFLSGHNINETVRKLLPHYGDDCPIVLVYHASWPDQRIIKGLLGDIAAKVKKAKLGRTLIILVGRALSRDVPNSKLYDAGFYHGFRRRKKS